jgi:SAM-dependent methyltransferase
MMQLLLGCGRDRTKKMFFKGREDWQGLVTLDINPEVRPDIVHDLTELPLPFQGDSADEIHLYDVLEHTRQQGDWRGFFAEFAEFWRILKPGGHLFGICPTWDGRFAWGDPGHTRVIQPESLTFLCQRTYAEQLDGPETTNRTDYRFVWRGDFEIVSLMEAPGPGVGFALQAIKPSRWRPPA